MVEPGGAEKARLRRPIGLQVRWPGADLAGAALMKTPIGEASLRSEVSQALMPPGG
ncbi:hypothetical protein I545_2706 [Mycobacterium kansasii 662]|uniref:Uncharacterized protein n=2 Tax=Mycobacterium kansasii TaxID=1768 RepID=A0A1V3WMJ5_MYCKA|nr:hypothetical protein I547_4648 [Mycobacterium kansasii 824]EUA18697.1 hypothetical protein I545_2706 [Mycobacterium kansasii 662]KEP40621.1 hypothetical protein MKSMC1_42410 [Mycobacterium kansasii]OOK68199.1 hypothetical protein BZL29_6911 [Mycobacterium kansasii]OOK71801.1 hypothetical protein BZL30_5554 [Mycobacterium kansasii]